MKHELHIEGRRFALRPVQMDDAELIVALRTDPELGRYLHGTSPRVADQIAWFDSYERRPGDYYFMIVDQTLGEAVGTIGLYDVHEGAGEWGRWLIRRGSLAAVESAALIYRVGFEQLRLDRLYCRTVADNLQVVSFHDSMGAARTRTIGNFARLADGMHDGVEHQVTRDAWEQLRPRLERLAQRVAQA